MSQAISWENKLILHLSKYSSAFKSTLGRYRILRETATSISTLEGSTPYPEDGGSRFHRNVSAYLQKYTAS